MRTWIVAALSACAVGCVLQGPGDLKRDLSQAAGVRLDREFAFTLGPVGTWIARKVVDDPDVSLGGVRRVEVGVYRVLGPRRGHAEPARLDPATQLPGWEPIVRVHDDDEDVFVLVRHERETIRGLLVVVAESDEWVLVRIRGRLDEVVEQLIEQAFDEAGRPELYARTREERGLPPRTPS